MPSLQLKHQEVFAERQKLHLILTACMKNAAQFNLLYKCFLRLMSKVV